MSSFNGDKKREHEAAAAKAYAANDYAKAFFHTAQAAEFTFKLAEQSEGKLARAYLSEANKLIDMAARMKTMKVPASIKEVRGSSVGVDESGQAEVAAEHKVESDIRLSDVKGLEEAKQIVKRTLINPVKYPKESEKLRISPGKGLLLYGPPGTGKTMFARAIAGEMNLPFIYKRASELKDKYVGGSEKNTVQLFKDAYSYKQSLVFLDECDAILSAVGNQKANIVTSFIAELDGFVTHKDSHTFILLATNKPWMIDSRVLQRLGAAAYVGLPNAEVRKDILAAALAQLPLAEDVNIDELVSMTEGFSGRELAGQDMGLCFVAKTNAFDRWIARIEASAQSASDGGDSEVITRNDFIEALKHVIPESKRNPQFVKQNLEWSLSGRGAHPESGDGDDSE
mgnify:CR=1 FL=1